MGKPFGQEYNEECAAIREELVAEGWDPADAALIFEVSKRYEAAHKNDLTLRERQEIWKSNQPPSTPRPDLTDKEIDYLIERLGLPNEPVGIGLVSKLKAYRIA